MRYLRKFEEHENKIYWKVFVIPIENLILSMKKLGIKEDSYAYEQLINIFTSNQGKEYITENDFIYIFYERGFFDYVAAGNIQYLKDKEYKYEGAIINEPWEIDAMKYNL